MPAPYSTDLREKAVAAVDRGENKSHVSKLFPISRNPLDLGLKQREQTGTVAPKAHRERDEAKRTAFLETIAPYTPEQIVYGDQAGVDATQDYPYSYGPRGERFYALKLGHRTERDRVV